MRFLISAIALLLALAPASIASAWTRTHVSSVSARLDIDPEGHANVELNAQVEVEGGWLRELVISGLGSTATLNNGTVPFLVEVDGGRRFPAAEVELSEGVLTLRFERKTAPRRGSYGLALAYGSNMDAQASHDGNATRATLKWTLPPWESGLEDVRIEMVVPPGSRAVLDDNESWETETRRSGSRTILQWRRAHLPRTTPWTVTASVPRGAVHGILDRPASEEPSPRAAPAVSPPHLEQQTAVDPVALCAFAFLLIAALLKDRTYGRACQTRALRPVPVLSIVPATRVILTMAGSALGAWAYHVDVRAGWLAATMVAFLTLYRVPRIQGVAPSLGRWEPLEDGTFTTAQRLRRGELLGLQVPVDIGTLVGAAFVLGLVATALMAGPESGPLWLLGCVPFVTGTRSHFPLTPQDKLRLLADLRSTTPGIEGQLMAYRDGSGRWHDVRLRLRNDFHPDLQFLDVAIESVSIFRGIEPRPVLLAVAKKHCSLTRVLHSCLYPRGESRSRVAYAKDFDPPLLHPLERALRELKNLEAATPRAA
ncbi:MAG: hypothetical protein KC416_03645 [Myxococcales bacterium]|nr:hypothetical protein [Myxococcales bacterium]